MQRRERAKFIISSDLLYGSLGCPPHIPESAWCLFIIEIQSTNDPTTFVQDEHLTMKTTNEKQTIDDFAKRIRLAQILRNSGNEEYANGQLDRALRNYNKARLLIHNRVTLIDEKQEEQYHQLLLKLHLNSGKKQRNNPRGSSMGQFSCKKPTNARDQTHENIHATDHRQFLLFLQDN